MSDTFGSSLRRARIQRGWSLRRLSDAIYYSAGYVSRVENGERSPTAPFARACDAALETDGNLLRLISLAELKTKTQRSRQPEPSIRTLTSIDLEQAADIVATMDLDPAVRLLEAMNPQRAADILAVMSSDPSARRLERMDAAAFIAIVQAMDHWIAVGRLTAMDPYVATGRLTQMAPELAAAIVADMGPRGENRLRAMRSDQAARIRQAMSDLGDQ